MEPGSVREERDPQSVPAGAEGRADVGPVCTDSAEDATERLAELDDSLLKKKEALAQMQQRRKELTKKKKEQDELRSKYYVFFENKKAKVCLAAERKMKQMEDLQREVERLTEECDELMEKNQQRQHRVNTHKKYQDYMEQVAEMTEFEDIEKLTLQLQTQLHFRGKLAQTYTKVEEQADQCRNTLRLLEDRSNLLQLQKTCKLTQLQNELQTTHSETLTWEKQCNQINEVAAKKTLLLGKIKMAIINLYEKTQGTEEAVEVDDMSDAEKQLDEIKIWIHDHNSMRPHKDPNRKDGGGPKRREKKGDKAKGSTV